MNKDWTEYRATKDYPYHISAGCVVYRFASAQRKIASSDNGNRLEFALLLRLKKNYPEQTADRWFLPKGTLGRKETLEQCAIRETEEESGLKIEIEQYLGITRRQWTDQTGLYRDKITHYFLAKYLSEDGAGVGDEHDDVAWFDSNEAIKKLELLQHKGEYEIAKRAKEILSK